MAEAISTTKNFSGQGEVLVSALDASGAPQGFRKIGQVTSLDMTVTTDVLTHRSSRGAACGVDFRRERIDAVGLEARLHSLDSENLALLLGGGLTTVVGASTFETLTASLGLVLRLQRIKVSNVVVKNSAETITYTVDVDYSVDADSGSVTPIATGSIAEDQEIKVFYDFATQNEVRFNGQSVDGYRWVRFEGLNTADGNPVTLDVFKVAVNTLKRLAVIRNSAGYHVLDGLALSADSSSESGYFAVKSLT